MSLPIVIGGATAIASASIAMPATSTTRSVVIGTTTGAVAGLLAWLLLRGQGGAVPTRSLLVTDELRVIEPEVQIWVPGIEMDGVIRLRGLEALIISPDHEFDPAAIATGGTVGRFLEEMANRIRFLRTVSPIRQLRLLTDISTEHRPLALFGGNVMGPISGFSDLALVTGDQDIPYTVHQVTTDAMDRVFRAYENGVAENR